MKNNIKNFIKDMIPVLLGVLVAFWINNWNEDRKDEIYLKKFYTSLKKEFKEIDKEITEKTPYQQRLVDTLDIYSNNETISLLEVIDKAGGVNGPIIKLNYWKAFSNSKMELLEFDKLSILSDIEEGNDLLNYKRNKLIDFLYSNMAEKGKKEKAILKIMMVDFITTQTEVQKGIQKILNDK